MTYLITFACYGCHLHGDDSGSVDRKHCLPGSRLVESDRQRTVAERQRMDQPLYELDRSRREAVLAAVVERCSDRRWSLLAAHVRTNHVHIVVEADVRPERMMNDLKSYASRHLNRLGMDEPARKRWARHGSTRWLCSRRVCRQRFGMWWTSKVNKWLSSRDSAVRITAPSGHGSVSEK